MVPAAFVRLDAIPLTPTGKVDRRALERMDVRPGSHQAYRAPRNGTEQRLAALWADALNLEPGQIGVHDNFFELGGDSILSMQIIAKANRAGLRFTPKHVFQHQTIAELSAVAGTTPAIQAEQGLVTGPIPLTPIQHWFFEQNLPDLHHWNQTSLLEMRQTLDLSILEHAMQHLLVHHDILRTLFRPEADGWHQDIVAPKAPLLCTRVDLSVFPEGQQEIEMVEAAAQFQDKLDLEQGPLVRATLFDCGPQKSAYLLVVIHHLVVDSVSWWILLNDLQMACQQLSTGKMVQLPPKTTSFKHWAERLATYAQSAELQQELTYWLAAPHAQASRLPVDYPEGANTVALARTVSVSLSSKETTALLQEVPRAYHTQINDLLLTALGQAFACWTGEDTLLIDLEGHGREDVVDDIDLSRTMGWFTTIFPVLIQLGHDAAAADALKAVKEQLRHIPKRGIGYGVLRYLSRDTEVTEKLRALPQAEVCFNYLGRLNQVVPGPVFLKSLQETIGPLRGPRGPRRYLLEVGARLDRGQLRCDWTYSEGLHRRDTIEGLAQGFIEALRTLIMHCQSPGAGGVTPADFPKMKLSQPELDELMTALGEWSEGD
jgi:non-ribosomal peptide synthase protein (TIGR01720 family)